MLFNEMSFSRRHIKLVNLSKCVVGHSFVRVSVVDRDPLNKCWTSVENVRHHGRAIARFLTEKVGEGVVFKLPLQGSPG